jgi:hypothetical protein
MILPNKPMMTNRRCSIPLGADRQLGAVFTSQA